MIRFQLQILFTLILFQTTHLFANKSQMEWPDKKIPVQITYCHDGDTCRIVTNEGTWFNARIAGIDAPEVGRFGKRQSSGQPLGELSRDTLSTRTVHKSGLFMRQVDLDPYNRPVVELYDGTECINLKMLELGMAERYQGPTKRLDRIKYEQAESKAKSTKVGIWGAKNYVSPKTWRKAGKL